MSIMSIDGVFTNWLSDLAVVSKLCHLSSSICFYFSIFVLALFALGVLFRLIYTYICMCVYVCCFCRRTLSFIVLRFHFLINLFSSLGLKKNMSSATNEYIFYLPSLLLDFISPFIFVARLGKILTSALCKLICNCLIIYRLLFGSMSSSGFCRRLAFKNHVFCLMPGSCCRRTYFQHFIGCPSFVICPSALKNPVICYTYAFSADEHYFI